REEDALVPRSQSNNGKDTTHSLQSTSEDEEPWRRNNRRRTASQGQHSRANRGRRQRRERQRELLTVLNEHEHGRTRPLQALAGHALLMEQHTHQPQRARCVACTLLVLLWKTTQT